MSKGLHRNQEFYQKGHDDLGRGLRRAGLKGLKTAAVKIPGSDAPPWNTGPDGKPKPKPTYMNKGGPVKKKKKGYNYGGMVTEGYGHGGMVKRAGFK